MAIDNDDLEGLDAEPQPIRKAKGKRSAWPKLPNFDAAPADIRAYLTEAAELPDGWRVALAERHGPHSTDPMTVFIERNGHPNVAVRFDSQRTASKPGELRAAFSEATRGVARMRHPSGPQASDFYLMLMALAHVTEQAVIADTTYDWCQGFIETATILELSFDHERRYDSLLALRARGEFDGRRARAYINGGLPEGQQHVVVLDPEGVTWCRAGEFITWVRAMKGEHISQHTLDALLAEVDVDRIPMEVNRRHRGYSKVRLVLYRFPNVPAFPSLVRDERESE
jgi:hypothetical protein